MRRVIHVHQVESHPDPCMDWLWSGESGLFSNRSFERKGMLISVWNCREEKTYLEYFQTRTIEPVPVSKNHVEVLELRILAQTGFLGSWRIPNKIHETYL
jgi:hypothetical protein